jgi:hypothetical protein
MQECKMYPLLESLRLLLACFLGEALDHPRASNRENMVISNKDKCTEQGSNKNNNITVRKA